MNDHISNLESVLEFLKAKKGIPIIEVCGRLNLDRDAINNIRRFAKPPKKKELLQKIIEAFEDDLLDYTAHDDENRSHNTKETIEELKSKYIKILEEQNNLLKAERENIKLALMKKIEDLERKIDEKFK
jgi:transcriptional regulator with XRE-family HTH domain